MRRQNPIHCLMLAVMLVAAAGLVAADPDRVDYEQLREMTLEELMGVQVTSVAGVGRDWFKTPAAVYVITNEELRRSGHRALAEALRLAPGMTVMRADSNTWNISARGGSGFTNKLLVLTDGRTTYDLLFSGTFWDVQDVLLEDLDRIEVVRGPGATLWGANAVNGVINITTKSAKETQGLYVGGGFGTYERAFGEARYGFQIDDNSWMRIWGKWFDRDAFELAGPTDGHDEWDMGRGGLRYDREGDDHTFLTVTSSAYSSNRIGERIALGPTIFDGRAEGGHALFRFGQEIPDGDGWRVQGYYDRTARVTAGGFQVDRDTFDLDWRHHFKWGDIHETVWGAGYRYTTDRTDSVTDPAFFLAFDPEDRALHTVSAFIQHTVDIIPDELFVMVGSKFEHNDHTGFEVQPSGRIWWTPDDQQTLWVAISRPVRTPSRTEEDLAIVLPPVLDFSGNRGVKAEELIAYEAGYRRQVTPNVALDLSLFYNDYRNLVSRETLSPPGAFPMLLTFRNRGEAESYGAELAATWRVAPNWTLRGSYSVIEINEQRPASGTPEGGAPQQQAQLRSALDITDNLEFNAAIYYVDNIPVLNVRHYLRLDLGVTWRITENFDIAVWGQNLLDAAHREAAGPAEFERGGYVMATVRY
jgi:iron complex outermembrane recepter protein